MPRLLLGPLLRFVGADEATVWVETDAPCEVSVLGDRAPTFTVDGHHYALVHVTGLEPATVTEYSVALDDEPVWPLDDAPFGPSYIRTLGHLPPVQVVFGSCRVSAPDVPPYVLTQDESDQGREVDALAGLVTRMHLAHPIDWPDLLLLVGDQVYADILSPQIQRRVTARRGAVSPDDLEDAHGEEAPENEVADFEEYTWLYGESWVDESLRWLLSTVATAMIFDDHDVHDDWNTSATWVADMRARPWWRRRVVGAYSTYWIYQHLGNLSPADLDRDPTWRLVREGGDHTATVRAMAERAADEVAGTRWSFRRDFGDTRLVVLDSRAGRVLEEGRRSMLSDDEMAWVEEQVAEPGARDLLIATSLPWLLAPGLHHLEAWNEAVCGGAWGRFAARHAETMRQAVDLEHWAAFNHSFRRLTDLIGDAGSGEGAPRTIAVLSGDVHHAYIAEASFPDRPEVRSQVIQAVCSPIRNPLSKCERRVMRLLHTRVAGWIGRLLARAAGVRPPSVSWEFTQRPTFDNQIATLVLGSGGVDLSIDKTHPDDWETPHLHPSLRWPR